MSLVNITMVTTAAKPTVDRDGKQSSIVFRAGQKYQNVEKTPEIEEWLKRGFAYLSHEKPPATPPQIGPFISSSRSADDDAASEGALNRLADLIADRLGIKGRRPAMAS